MELSPEELRIARNNMEDLISIYSIKLSNKSAQEKALEFAQKSQEFALKVKLKNVADADLLNDKIRYYAVLFSRTLSAYLRPYRSIFSSLGLGQTLEFGIICKGRHQGRLAAPHRQFVIFDNASLRITATPRRALHTRRHRLGG